MITDAILFCFCFRYYIRAACKFVSASADSLIFRSRDHRKDPVNFASFISDIYCRADVIL
jgi:hypothetical protein